MIRPMFMILIMTVMFPFLVTWIMLEGMAKKIGKCLERIIIYFSKEKSL